MILKEIIFSLNGLRGWQLERGTENMGPVESKLILKVREQKAAEVRQAPPHKGCSGGCRHKKSQPENGWLCRIGGGGGN